MNKQISLLLMIIFPTLTFYAQTEKNVAPVKWERYKVSESEISLQLPKMPVSEKFIYDCNELVKEHYAAYARGTVYQLIIASKQKISPFCTDRRLFNQTIFEDHIEELKQVLIGVEKTNKVDESKLTIKGREVTKLVGKLTTHWVFDDLKNNKWLVLSSSNRENSAFNEKQLINSIEFGKSLDGIELGNGASKTFGDEEKTVENKAEVKPRHNTDEGKDDLLRIFFKPRASYTEEARNNQTQGSIMLRVTFLANGGIGEILTNTFLPNGLTEQAKIAASKIVFMPQLEKGKPISVTRQVQYSFSIY